jgi:hypothetical protein
MQTGLHRSWRRARTLAAIASFVAVGLALGGVVAACGGRGPTGVLQGRVTLGPITPVQQAGDPPDVRPYAATIAIETPGGDVAATVTSGNDGAFSVRLRPGSYRLVPRSPAGHPLPRAEPQDVSVAAGSVTKVAIAYDSGIR